MGSINQRGLNMLIPKKELDTVNGEGLTFAAKVHKCARLYATNGIAVIPLAPGGKALPRGDHYLTYSDASKDLAVIDKWFDPKTGSYSGFNIGIVCGTQDGVWAVDADVKGDHNGIEAFNEMAEAYGPLPDCPIQDTPGGGRHYLFHWADGATSSTSKLADALDTRGGTRDAYKGHIVAYPSRINGIEDRQYVWALGGEVPDTPQWLLDKMGHPWGIQNQNDAGLGNEEVTTADLEVVVPLDQIERMLDAIDIEILSYDEWLSIGQAINSQHQSIAALEAWDAWSRTGSRYKPGECHVRWKGFDPSGSIRIGTLFYHARANGWEMDPELDKTGGRFEALVAKLNMKYAVVLVGNKVKILREKKGDGISDNYDLLDREAFLTLLANHRITAMTMAGTPTTKNVGEIWLAHKDRRTFPEGIVLCPPPLVAPAGSWNTWKGLAVEPKKGDCSKFTNHIKEILCNGHEDHYEWVLDWIADLFQEPGNPKGTAIVVRGEEGTGKGTVASTIGECFGSHYRHFTNSKQLVGNFNAYAASTVFLFADEVTWGGNIKSDGVLKGLVSERVIEIERKGIDSYSSRNVCRVFIASNNEWVIPTGPQARRWLVLEISNQMAKNRDYFNAIYEEIQNGGREAFAYDMLHRKITRNLATAPETDQLREQKIISLVGHYTKDSLVSWWSYCLQSHSLDDGITDIEVQEQYRDGWPSRLNKKAMYQTYEDWCIKRHAQPRSYIWFYTTMKKYGIETVRGKAPTKEAQREYYSTIPDYDRCLRNFHTVTGIKIERPWEEGE